MLVSNAVRFLAVVSLCGIPGVGQPSKTTLAMAAWSPAEQYVLGLARESREPILFRPVEGQLRGSPLVPAQPGVSPVHLSPRGRAVALYYDGQERIEIWRGLPDQPIRETELLLPTPGAPVTSRMTRLECPCVPTGVLDADSDEPRIVLVPVASRTEGGNQ